jgi:hypothetical protein
LVAVPKLIVDDLRARKAQPADDAARPHAPGTTAGAFPPA